MGSSLRHTLWTSSSSNLCHLHTPLLFSCTSSFCSLPSVSFLPPPVSLLMLLSLLFSFCCTPIVSSPPLLRNTSLLLLLHTATGASLLFSSLYLSLPSSLILHYSFFSTSTLLSLSLHFLVSTSLFHSSTLFFLTVFFTPGFPFSFLVSVFLFLLTLPSPLLSSFLKRPSFLTHLYLIFKKLQPQMPFILLNLRQFC